ncbi:Hypothetical predicted protein [Olea europaea subsp. europaea]|uniref:Uncharacterized protein n=1 Tax=Olea europaea subsp. europaea TaxID=158383 RepID=A0A8S0QAR2_OLEEU|nr:Hypothetical predicted protein [Olea europaea subsp. europaea]
MFLRTSIASATLAFKASGYSSKCKAFVWSIFRSLPVTLAVVSGSSCLTSGCRFSPNIVLCFVDEAFARADAKAPRQYWRISVEERRTLPTSINLAQSKGRNREASAFLYSARSQSWKPLNFCFLMVSLGSPEDAGILASTPNWTNLLQRTSA